LIIFSTGVATERGVTVLICLMARRVKISNDEIPADLRPCQTQKTVIPTVCQETGAEFLGELDSLTGDSDVRDGHSVRIDIAGCT
jgi:hypothetical protein